MPANYPGSLPALATNKADATVTATDHKDHHNQAGLEVNAIGAELGTDPSGSYATVKARIDAIVTNGFFNVKDVTYGAVGNGSTNDSTAVQAAIDAAAAAGGGVVFFPPGTYMCNVTAKPRVRLLGSGQSVTVMKAVASSNIDVVKGLNFATLVGKAYAAGDYALGAYEFGMEHLTIDGNAANVTAGWGVRVWGRAPTFQNVQIVNCNDGGLWTEFTEVDNFNDPVQILEGAFNNLTIHGVGGVGWQMRGPHDSHAGGQCAIFACTGRSLYVGPTGGIAFDLLDVYMCADGIYVDNAAFGMRDGQIATDAKEFRTGTTGNIGLEFAAGSGLAHVKATFDGWRDLGVSGTHGVPGNAGVAILLRGDDHLLDVEVKGCDTGIVLDGAAGYNIRSIFQANGYFYKTVSEARPGRMSASGSINTGEILRDPASAAWNAQSRISLVANGTAGTQYEECFGGRKLTWSGWQPQLPASFGTMLTDLDAIFTQPLGSGSAVNYQLFRDNITEKLTYKDNTGAFVPMESRGLKLPVRVAAPVNTTVAAPGATVDGVTMVAADRVLLANQTTTSQNGIYAWVSAAAPMTRATDADTALKLTDSLLVTVDEGTTNKDSIWTLSTNKPITVGTTALRFTRIHPAAVAVSQPSGIYFAPGTAKLENMPRAQGAFTNTAMLTTQIIRVFPLGALRAGDTLAALNFRVATTASAGITNSWAGIARLSDRVVLAVSATSTATTAAQGLKTFTFTSAYTADKDELLVGFVMYQATTVPTFHGVTHGDVSIIADTPVMNGSSNTGQTTPIAVAATMTAFTAAATIPYCYAT